MVPETVIGPPVIGPTAAPHTVWPGDPVDLWAGLKPLFPDWGCPWRQPPGRLLRPEIPPEGPVSKSLAPESPVTWDPLSLSFHDDVTDLLTHLFDYTVAPMVRLDGPQEIPAGVLMAGQSLAGLEERLTIPLTCSRPETAYLLVRLVGRRGTRYYTPDWEGLNRKLRILHWLTPEGRKALARLRLRGMRHEGVEFYGDLSARLAKRYLGAYEAFGTHVVRSISYGACLFQVFEVAGAVVSGVRDAFLREGGSRLVRGPAVFGLSQFTRSPWVTRASPILSAGDCPRSRAVTHHALWQDGDGGPASLLSSRAKAVAERTAVLDGLPACSPVAVSFSCQALSLEDFRADAWSRVMRAGLCQTFPGIRLSGWRQRTAFSLPAFLASAGLVGEEALCKTPDPMLPELAFGLDLRRSGIGAGIGARGGANREPTSGPVRLRLPDTLPDTGCLALFAATDPATGQAAEYTLETPAFDPQKIKIPFVDGALCLTDAGGNRTCLVEGVWLGPQDDGRPGIVADPADCDRGLLVRHAGPLAGYLRLIGVLQGGGGPEDADLMLRRCAAWLAERTAGDDDLAGVRWLALREARGGPVPPVSGTGSPAPAPAPAPEDGDRLTRVLVACRDMLVLHPDSDEGTAALCHAEQQLQAVYADGSGTPDPDDLEQRSLAACEAVQRHFAAFAARPGMPEQAVMLFSAGATLKDPPDPRRTPHALVPGEEPYALLWNALLGIRVHLTHCRAESAAARGRTAEAIALLEHEVLDGWECPRDPAGDTLAALEALSESLPGITGADRTALWTDIGTLLALGGPARLLAGADASSPAARDGLGPQMRRLLVVLGTLRACRTAGLALPPLDSLTPAVLRARIGQALTALDQIPAYA